MIQPPYLHKGDKIGIVAPARSVSFEEVHPSIRMLQKWGFEVVLGTHIFKRYNQFAGQDEYRLADLQQMLDDPSVKAVICARGGYGTVRIIDQLNLANFLKNPKWIVGYSDITVIHSHIHRNCATETIHAVMPFNIKSEDCSDDSCESLKIALTGQKIRYTLPVTPLSQSGNAEGILTGGNLSILVSLMGSASEADTANKILFLEDVDEYLYHIDRMMMNLKRGRKLENLKGLIVGDMNDMKDNTVPFGKSAQEIIAEAVDEYSFPVCFDFPAGHGRKNLALILGKKITFSVDSEMTIEF